MKILEASVACFVRKGFEGASITELTAAAKVNRALINHYFKTKESMTREALKFVAESGKSFTDAFMEERADISNPVERYIRANFEWARIKPAHASFLWLSIQRATYDASFKRSINDLFANSRKRVAQLVAEANSKSDPKRRLDAATQIHSSLVGMIFTSMLASSEQLETYERHAIEAALAISSCS